MCNFGTRPRPRCSPVRMLEDPNLKSCGDASRFLDQICSSKLVTLTLIDLTKFKSRVELFGQKAWWQTILKGSWVSDDPTFSIQQTSQSNKKRNFTYTKHVYFKRKAFQPSESTNSFLTSRSNQDSLRNSLSDVHWTSKSWQLERIRGSPCLTCSTSPNAARRKTKHVAAPQNRHAPVA